MAIRKIATIGHPVLREVARKVTLEELRSPRVQTFIDDLVETMHDADGAGLAAIQVYEPIRICAIEVRNNPRYPYKPPIPLTTPLTRWAWCAATRAVPARARTTPAGADSRPVAAAPVPCT